MCTRSPTTPTAPNINGYMYINRNSITAAAAEIRVDRKARHRLHRRRAHCPSRSSRGSLCSSRSQKSTCHRRGVCWRCFCAVRLRGSCLAARWKFRSMRAPQSESKRSCCSARASCRKSTASCVHISACEILTMRFLEMNMLRVYNFT